MPSLVQFDTTKFDFANEPPNPINPIRGESVLRWVKQALGDEFGIGEPAAEDWGWYCDVTRDGVVYLLGASAEPNDDGSWHVMIQVEPRRSMMDKLSAGRPRMRPSPPRSPRRRSPIPKSGTSKSKAAADLRGVCASDQYSC